MFRRMRINTQERAISGDINRLQSFAAKGFNEAMRHMLLVESNSTTYAVPVATTTPLTAEILHGLMVHPAVAALDLTIDPGAVLMVNPPAAGPDDSICIPVLSAGIPSAGTLAMTANASGSLRIDVIECRLHAVPITATDNRDIFDPTTGLFTATTVTKEIEQQLEFRVRAGTPGSGFPGSVDGWLPLAVASVPNGATTCDNITFWDVRPLAGDRVQFADVKDQVYPELTQLDARCERVDGSTTRLKGRWGANINGRKVGGRFVRSNPGTDDSFLLLNDLAAEPITASPLLYVAFPYGLPRWARYAASPAARLPLDARGIWIVSNTAPNLYGAPSSALTVPNLLGTTSDAICVCVLQRTGGSQYDDWNATNKIQQCYPAGTGTGNTVSGTLDVSVYDFAVPTTFWPPNAKAIYVMCSADLTINDTKSPVWSNFFNVQSEADTSGSTISIDMGKQTRYNNTGSSETYEVKSGVIRIPLPVEANTPGNRLITWVLNPSDLGSGTALAATATMQVMGYEF